jgi:aspartyl-tRNA(Asn)/glutamyl-tRNA(Gln) amidotransferase subunit C
MSLNSDQVKHIAKLSRIQLTDEEVEKYRTQLSAVLGYIEQLNELDTSNVLPTVNTTGLTNVLREDVQKDSLPVTDATKNSKLADKGFFVVPNVFE